MPRAGVYSPADHRDAAVAKYIGTHEVTKDTLPSGEAHQVVEEPRREVVVLRREVEAV